MFSRLRKAKGDPIPLRFRLASNPGGKCHTELKDEYVDKITKDPDNIFIPAGLDDNPHLETEEYEKALSELDYITRRQLRYGDWNVVTSGNIFLPEWFDSEFYVDKIPTSSQPEAKHVRFWDCAATKQKDNNDPDWTVGAYLVKKGNLIYIKDIERERLNPAEVEKLMVQTAARDGASVEICIEQEGGASGKAIINHYTNLLLGYNVHGISSTGSKEEYAKPLSAAIENKKVKMLRGQWNKPLLDEMIVFPIKDFHDDQVDACSKAFARLTGISTKNKRAGTWGKR